MSTQDSPSLSLGSGLEAGRPMVLLCLSSTVGQMEVGGSTCCLGARVREVTSTSLKGNVLVLFLFLLQDSRMFRTIIIKLPWITQWSPREVLNEALVLDLADHWLQPSDWLTTDYSSLIGWAWSSHSVLPVWSQAAVWAPLTRTSIVELKLRMASWLRHIWCLILSGFKWFNYIVHKYTCIFYQPVMNILQLIEKGAFSSPGINTLVWHHRHLSPVSPL